MWENMIITVIIIIIIKNKNDNRLILIIMIIKSKFKNDKFNIGTIHWISHAEMWRLIIQTIMNYKFGITTIGSQYYFVMSFKSSNIK